MTPAVVWGVGGGAASEEETGNPGCSLDAQVTGCRAAKLRGGAELSRLFWLGFCCELVQEGRMGTGLAFCLNTDLSLFGRRGILQLLSFLRTWGLGKLPFPSLI